MKWYQRLLWGILALCLALPVMAAEPREALSGFQLPVDRNYKACAPNGLAGWCYLDDTGTDSYPGCPRGRIYHPGRDINIDIPGGERGIVDVLAVADGIVVDEGPNNWGAIGIKHRYKGETYYSVYGHMDDKDLTSIVKNGNEVKKGDVLGKFGVKGTGASHLHFEIRKANHPDPTDASFFCPSVTNGKTLVNASLEMMRSWYEDSMAFVQSHPAYRFPVTSHGNIAWYPRGDVCSQAKRVFRYDGNNATEVTTAACPGTIASTCQTLLKSDMAENHWIASFYRFFEARGLKMTTAIQCEQSLVDRELLIQSPTSIVITSGPGAGLADGAGGGGQRVVVDIPAPAPRPDFVVKDVRLHTPWGLESYKYGMMESINTKAQSGNTGEGSCLAGESSTIIGHFYLSQGYKEDAHGDWRKVDSTETQCSNLKPGDTNTETKNTVISDWITTPGIYNIVYCIDHPKTEQNNGGDHAEKHESNNCSTEAVFEVTGNSYENTTNIDLVTSGLQFRGTPPVYAADSIRLGAWITNAGTQGLYTDIRSSYGVSCNGSPQIQLADDGTEAKLLGPGMNAWEEILSPVTLPNVSGSCVATFCADHAYMVNEVNKVNNCTSLGFNLLPRTNLPDLITHSVGIAGGKTRVKAGDKFNPAFYIQNIGNTRPSVETRSLYQYRGPQTGNLWVDITTDGTEAKYLDPGKQVREEFNGGMRISTKGLYQLQVCADYLLQQPEISESNNCSVSGWFEVY